MNENTAFYECPGCQGEGRVVGPPYWDGDYNVEVCNLCWGAGHLRVFAVVARSNPDLISLCADDEAYELITEDFRALLEAAGITIFDYLPAARMTDYGLYFDLLRLPPAIDTRQDTPELDWATLTDYDAARYDQMSGWMQ